MLALLRSRTTRFAALTMTALALLGAGMALAADQTSGAFAGRAVNGGTVTASQGGGQIVLTLSADFQVPGSPDPHWQVVDSRGNVFMLHKLKIKEDRINTRIALPGYVSDVAKVQMWCAWAEVLLGEAAFANPVVAAR